MRPIGNHIQAAILRAIATIVETDMSDRVKPTLIVEAMQSTDWASATFVGAIHRIDIRLDGTALDVDRAMLRLASRIADCDIPIAGHIVAEIKLETHLRTDMDCNIVAQSLTVNALTIVD